MSTEVDSVDPPTPAKKVIPEWYKKLETTTQPSFDEISNNDGRILEQSTRACMPFFDTLTSGYIQKLWSDIIIKLIDNHDGTIDLKYKFSQTPEPISIRSFPPDIKLSDDFVYAEFVWKQPWTWKLPRGYSALVTHPHNRFDLPFFTTHGIIDRAMVMKDLPSIPFYLKKSCFVGNEVKISSGTPIFQIMPYKRDDWESSVKPFSHELYLESTKIYRYFTGGYRKLFHKRKKFK